MQVESLLMWHVCCIGMLKSAHQGSNFKYRWIPLKPEFWEHKNLSSLSVLLYIITLYKEKEKQFWQKIWAKWESSLTTVWLKQDPPVIDKVKLNW